MGELVDLVDKVRKYYKFSPAEWRSILITIFVLAFIIHFGQTIPDADVLTTTAFSVYNFIIAVIVVAISFMWHLSAKKIAALHVGFRAQYNLWTFGILISLVVTFISLAWGRPVWVLFAGGVMLQHLAGHRLGFFRYGLNYYEAGWISMIGPISSIVLAAIFKALSGILPSVFVLKAITFNLLFAFWNALPIPPLDGSRMMFGSRMVYALSFFFVLAAVILLWIDIPIWIALVGSVLIGLLGWILYYIFIERGFWHGPYP
ncbi:MAG TPA: hypothetical protein VJH97_04255 [Candidatus Nanoarchaeia archaeon]|nr:hypothetical protein [Candidatus Nanoarchaeia archaeon]